MALLPKLLCRKRYKREILKNVEVYTEVQRKMRWTQLHKEIVAKILKKTSFSRTELLKELNNECRININAEKKLDCVIDALKEQSVLKYDGETDTYIVFIKTPRYRYDL